VRHTVDFRAMQKVQWNSAISDVFEVQGLRRNRRKGRMPKFSFSHARKFQFPGRAPGPVAGAGLAGMILASSGRPAGGGNRPALAWPVLKVRIGPALADDVVHSKRQPGRKWCSPGWLLRCVQYPFVTRTDECVHVGSLDFPPLG